MYKKQMLFQKIICYLVLIGSGVLFFYSLGFMTEFYECFRQLIEPTTMVEQVPGAKILYEMQPFNKELTKWAIILILLAVFLLVTSTHLRRRYYVTNYIATAATAGVGFYFAATTVVELLSWKATYLAWVDFNAWKQFVDEHAFLKIKYMGPEHTEWFDAGIIIMVIFMVLLALLVANMIWKILLMKAEKKLLQVKDGKETV